MSFVGALAASAGNIAFGWASDVVGSRRGWMLAGLVLTIASYALLDKVATLTSLLGSVVFYQLSLNMMLAPLAAWAADLVPDEDKGLLGGWFAAGPVAGALTGILVTAPQLHSYSLRLGIVCLTVLLLALPLLLKAPVASAQLEAPGGAKDAVRHGRGLLLMWLSRLLVQVAGSVLFSFLFYYFRSLAERPGEADIARLATLALFIALPVSLLCGQRSDQSAHRKSYLVAANVGAALGLGTMAFAPSFLIAAVGYVIFQCALTVFLSLHAGFAMLLLPSASRRGRDLGLLNLTNTLPSLIAPLLAISVVPALGFAPLLLLLAVLVGLSASCVLLIRDEVA